jgi:hypothetical protein
MQIWRKLLCNERLFDTNIDSDARITQLFNSVTSDVFVGVSDTNNYTRNFCINDYLSAWASFSGVAAWFERGVQRCTMRVCASCLQGHNFGVCFTRLHCCATKNLAISRNYDCANPRVWTTTQACVNSSIYCQSHHLLVKCRHSYFFRCVVVFV